MDKISSVGVVAIKDNKALLVREGKESGHMTGVYGLPGGRVEEGETELDAAFREFSEETGLISNKESYREFQGNYLETPIHRKDGTTKLFLWRVFKVENFSGDLKNSKDVSPVWIEIDKLEDLDKKRILLPNTIKVIKQAQKSNV